MPCSSRCHRISSMMSSDVIIDTASCLPSRPPSRPRTVIISYRIPDDIATQSITGDTRYDDTRLPLISPPISSPYCFPPRFPPHRVARRVGSKHDAILHAIRIASTAYPSRPSHRFIHQAHCLLRSDPCGGSSSHPSHRLIDHAPSDETSGEQAKRRAWRVIGNGKAERHDIRHLDDNANAPPRPPYSPYDPHDAQTPTRTRPRENDPSTSLITPQTGRQRDDGRDETTGRPACLLTDTTTKRPTPRRTATRPTTRQHRTKGRDEKKKTDRPSKRKAARKTKQDMRLNEKIATRYRNRNPPANGGNRGDGNDSTHIAHASSQFPQGYHRSMRS